MLGSCSSAGENRSEVEDLREEPSSSSEPASSEESSQPEETVIRNPLTGEAGFSEDAVGMRPVTVMINNIGQALPQRGIAAADVMFEIVVEGGITRMMGVYADIDSIPYVGPVRSARHYYVSLSEGLNAIYTHFGGSPAAYNYISQYGVDDVDGQYATDAFYQDTWRAQTYGRNTASLLTALRFGNRLNRRAFRWKGILPPSLTSIPTRWLSLPAVRRTTFLSPSRGRITRSFSTTKRPGFMKSTATASPTSTPTLKRRSPIQTSLSCIQPFPPTATAPSGGSWTYPPVTGGTSPPAAGRRSAGGEGRRRGPSYPHRFFRRPSHRQRRQDLYLHH